MPQTFEGFIKFCFLCIQQPIKKYYYVNVVFIKLNVEVDYERIVKSGLSY